MTGSAWAFMLVVWAVIFTAAVITLRKIISKSE